MSFGGLSDEQSLRLIEELSINEAAALIAGVSPSQVYQEDYDGKYYIRGNQTDPSNASEVFYNASIALSRAVRRGKLKAVIAIENNNQYLAKEDLKTDWLVVHKISVTDTTIDREDLVDWLNSRGCYPSFFFPEGAAANYMNKEHPNYSPKLAACVGAWEAAQVEQISGTVKQFMTDWLKQKANQYGVQNDAETTKAFEQMAAIANFSTKGGRVSSKLTPLSDTDYSQDSDLIKKRTFDSVLVAELPTREELQSLTDAEDDLPF